MAKKAKKRKPRKGAGQERSRIRLSQCMIVKDEEANIRQALSWGKRIVWEQIVVDTGSSDHTAELARELGAAVYSYPWDGDFSAAKNFAIEQAKGNWIAFLDADEWLAPEETKVLMRLLSKLHPYRQLDAVRTKLANLDEDGSILNVSYQDRFFRRIPELRYRNRIHEELCRRNGKEPLQYWDAQGALTIRHSGYAGEERQKRKGERNIQILETELQRNPRDGMNWVYLGDAYRSIGNDGQAERCYRKVLNDPELEMTHKTAPLKAGLDLMSLMVNRPVEEIREDYETIPKCLKELGMDDHPDLDYFRGCMHWKEGNLQAAAEDYESTLQKIESYCGAEAIRAISELEFVNQVIAAAALLRGDLAKAVSFAVETLNINRYSADGLGILLQAFRTEWKAGMSAEPYRQFLSKLYDMQNLKDILFVYELSGKTDFSALQEEIREHMPTQVRQELETSS